MDPSSCFAVPLNDGRDAESGRLVAAAPAVPATVPIPWILAVVLRERRAVLAFTAVGIALSVVLGLVRRPQFTAAFSFLPQTTQDQARAGFASLAGQFGLPLGLLGGQSQPPQLYADILRTREVLLPIARDTFRVTPGGPPVSLREYLHVKGDGAVADERTMQTLRERVISASVAARTTGTVSVRVTTRSAQLSLAIANRLLEGLNDYNLVTRQSQAAAERRFTEARLHAAQASLREAEDDLQRFLQANRQFDNSAQLSFQRDRLQREVMLRQQIVSGLAQQYEDARIREVRDTPVITIVEHPALPVLPDPRGRVRLAIVLTILFGVLGVAFVLGREGWRRQQARAGVDPSYAMLSSEWQRVRTMFRRA